MRAQNYEHIYELTPPELGRGILIVRQDLGGSAIMGNWENVLMERLNIECGKVKTMI